MSKISRRSARSEDALQPHQTHHFCPPWSHGSKPTSDTKAQCASFTGVMMVLSSWTRIPSGTDQRIRGLELFSSVRNLGSSLAGFSVPPLTAGCLSPLPVSLL